MTDPVQQDSPGKEQRTESGPMVPRLLEIARWLWVASVLVGFVRSYVQLSDRGMLVSELHKAAPELSQKQIDSAANSGVMFSLVFSLAILGVYVLFSTRMVQGRGWARRVLAALGGLSVLGTVITLLAVATLGMAATTEMTGVRVEPLDLAFSVIVLILDAAALVAMFHPSSNRYFTEIAARGMRGSPASDSVTRSR